MHVDCDGRWELGWFTRWATPIAASEFTQRYRTIAKSVSENTPLSGPAEVLLDGNTALVLTPGLIDYSRLLLQQTQVRNYTSFADWIADGCFPESPCPYRKH